MNAAPQSAHLRLVLIVVILIMLVVKTVWWHQPVCRVPTTITIYLVEHRLFVMGKLSNAHLEPFYQTIHHAEKKGHVLVVYVETSAFLKAEDETRDGKPVCAPRRRKCVTFAAGKSLLKAVQNVSQ